MTLDELAVQAVKNSETLKINNEGKKRTAFAYINQEIAKFENAVTWSFQDIDDAIEKAWKETVK